jgi:hypothetical protein
MKVKPLGLFRVAQGKGHDLREIEYGDFFEFPVFLDRLLLALVQVESAERTADGNHISPAAAG